MICEVFRLKNKRICGLLAVSAVLVMLLLPGCRRESPLESSAASTSAAAAPAQTQASVQFSPVQTEPTAASGLTFPYQMAEGKLEIESLFQFSGFNPDCNLEAGENIAALSFTNVSDTYCASVIFTAVLTDGTAFHFSAEDIPAGASVLAFSVDNAVYDGSTACASIVCDASFESEAPMMGDLVSVSVEETSVTLTNLTDEDLTNLVIHCHTLFDGSFFGGLTYSYPVEPLEPGGSVTLQAEDCYLGEASVVRIQQGG